MEKTIESKKINPQITCIGNHIRHKNSSILISSRKSRKNINNFITKNTIYNIIIFYALPSN